MPSLPIRWVGTGSESTGSASLAPGASRPLSQGSGELLALIDRAGGSDGPRLVLVTGAKSFVGGLVLQELRERHPRIRIHGSDDPDALAGEKGMVPVDAVYHMDVLQIPFGGSNHDARSALRSLRRILERALFQGCPVFLGSSMEVHPAYCGGFAGRVDAHEDWPHPMEMACSFPLDEVGSPRVHLVAELALMSAREAGLPVAVFRLLRSFTTGRGPLLEEHPKMRLLRAMARWGLHSFGASVPLCRGGLLSGGGRDAWRALAR